MDNILADGISPDNTFLDNIRTSYAYSLLNGDFGYLFACVIISFSLIWARLVWAGQNWTGLD